MSISGAQEATYSFTYGHSYSYAEELNFWVTIIFVPADVQTQLLAETDGENYVTAINSSPTPAFPEMSIELPAELLTMAISGREPSGTIRAVSFLYHNAENLFPNGSQNK